MWWDYDFSLDDINSKNYILTGGGKSNTSYAKPQNGTSLFAEVLVFLFLVLPILAGEKPTFMLPILSETRTLITEIKLTEIGEFGLLRIPRPGIPAHLHTGVDIRRPGKNYENEPIFPIYEGEVISIRDDGAFAQIILSHELPDGEHFWSVYEHIAGIQVDLHDSVDTGTPIARFMDLDELNSWGWQFDHFHLEILKQKPIELEATERHPRRLFATFALTCYSEEDLTQRYLNPIRFFQLNLPE